MADRSENQPEIDNGLTNEAEVLVVGAGIVGSAIAATLAAQGTQVLMVDAEPQGDVHATGRSAAVWRLIYGDPVVSELISASRRFLESPPIDFAGAPFLRSRPVLFVARSGEDTASQSVFERGVAMEPSVYRVDPEKALEMCPALNPSIVDAFVDPTAADIDVGRLHQSYHRQLRRNGGEMQLNRQVTAMRRDQGIWTVETPKGPIRARAVINAAGAWGDQLATMAGALPAHLSPRRRTMISFDPGDYELIDCPMVISVTERFYFKPDAGQIVASAFDEHRDEPRSVKPEEQDIAVIIDRLAEATQYEAMTRTRWFQSSWAGLRTFCPDRRPTLGWDVSQPGFFWAVGLGGYGIETAPAVAELCTELFNDPSIATPMVFAPGRRWR